MNKIKFAFWGTDDFAAKVLETLISSGFTPELVVTVPDKPKGRKLVITPPVIKVFAQEKGIKVDQPDKLKEYTPEGDWDLFVVAEYGKIIPGRLINLPKHKTINVHPSLLPKFRGSSPIHSFMLSDDEETGVSIMLIDEEMDHGPILKTENLYVGDKKIFYKELETKLAEMGGKMLEGLIPDYLNKDILPKPQDHEKATYCFKITKNIGLIDLEKDSPKAIYKKVLALTPWPSVYYFFEKNGKKIRIIITDAELVSDKLLIKKVKPEGKKEMPYEDFLRGNSSVKL